MANFNHLHLVLCTCLLFSRTLSSDNLLNKGGFVFERVVTNNLNQEFMSFTRQLEVEHLKPLVGNLKGLLNIHDEICTRAMTASRNNATRDGTKIQDYGFTEGVKYTFTKESVLFIPSGTYGDKTSTQVCAMFNARLPEYREAISKEILQMCQSLTENKIPIGIHLNSASDTLEYDSDDREVPKHLFHIISAKKAVDLVFKFADLTPDFYNITRGYPLYLSSCNQHKPYLTYFIDSHPRVIPRLLICEKPLDFLLNPAENLASKFLYHWINHACARDHPVLIKHVEHAITEINNILNYQLDAKTLLTYAQYYPDIVGNAGALTNENQISIDLISTPTTLFRSVNMTSKAKRSFPDDDFMLELPDSTNLTLVGYHTFLTTFNISETDLVKQIREYANTTDFSKDTIKEFFLTNQLHSHTNTTFTLARYKRNPYLIAAFGVVIIAFLATALYFMITAIMDLNAALQLPDLGEFSMDDQPPLATAAQLNEANGRISKLSINQMQIQQAITDGKKVTTQLEDQMLHQTFAIATWAAQLDVKTNIQFGIQVLSDFILKLGSILLGVQSGKTSPFALNLQELMLLKAKVSSQLTNAELTGKLSDIKTTLISQSKNLTLQFTIPITSPDTEYIFYKVVPIPVFRDNQTFIPSSPFSNLAVATRGHFYTTLSSEEFATCMGSPSICKTHFPMKYISTRFDCILTSFLDSKLTCPLVPIEAAPYPFLYFNDLEAIYSVPEKTTLRSSCSGPQDRTIDQLHEIEQIGKIKFKPNCKITTTDSIYEFHYLTPKVLVTENIPHWHTFDNIKFQIIPDKTFIIAPSMIHNTSNDLNITAIHVPTWEELLKESFQPKSTFKTVLQILLFALPIILIIYLLKYLNNTQTCNAFKGASLNRFTAMQARSTRWRRKRATDFQTFNDPPVAPMRSNSFMFSHMPLRPVQEAAMAHAISHPNIPFTTDFLHAQQRRSNVHFARTAPIYPNPDIQEDPYIAMEPQQPPEPPAYSTSEKATTPKVHKYNTRSQAPASRNPTSTLPPIPDKFEMN